MEFTIFGVLIPLIGALLLWQGSLLAMLVFVMAASLMGGSATVILTGLGNSSVPPAHVALLFLIVRCLVPGRDDHHRLLPSISANRWLVMFAVYGALGALLLPRIFDSALDLTPLRPIPGRGLTYALPLEFSNQNITVGIYLLGTMLAAVCGTMVMGRADAWRTVARTAAIVGSIHALLGIASVLFTAPLKPLFDFFRNGFYAQLSHTVAGVERMTGIFPESAVYAAYGLVWMIFLVELWLRRVESGWTGPAALLLVLTLLVSSSSTAYVGFAAYGLLLFIRLLFGGGIISPDRLLAMALVALTAVAGALTLTALQPELAIRIVDVLSLLTVDKLDSASGIQRAFWARQGFDAFAASYGLGVGVGSFRSSSLLTAILGSLGVVGVVTFSAALWRLVMPTRVSTWAAVADRRAATGAAASWTVLVSLAPASVAAPSPDPGLLWGLIGGVALGLRWLPLVMPIPPLRHETVTGLGQSAFYPLR
jgi:hypothetical protein